VTWVRPAFHQAQHRLHPLADPAEECVARQAGQALGLEVDVAEGDVVELRAGEVVAGEVIAVPAQRGLVVGRTAPRN
jgi:hypothetical protein